MPIADYYPRYRGGLLDDIQMFRQRSTNRVTHVQLRDHTSFAEEAFLKVTRSLAAGLCQDQSILNVLHLSGCAGDQ